jgi:glycosidase
MKKALLKTTLSLSLLLSLQNAGFAQQTQWHNDLRQQFQQNNAVIYGLVIRNFNAKDLNGDKLISPEKGEQIGTFVNATERLDELKALGINTLHILPITKTGKTFALGNAGSVYSMASFNEIEPSLDDKNCALSVFEEAKNFVEECHKRNIRVMIDLPACVSSDMFAEKPDIFLKDEKGNPIIPLDWSDVRLLKPLNNDGSLNKEVLELHKQFVDMYLSLGADGIRADVASVKPPALWKEVINYARKTDPNFAFLAESSDAWTKPVDKRIKPNNYNQILDEGFDAYYGSYFKIDEWKTAEDLNKHVIFNLNLFKKHKNPVSSIGSFATHDEKSPVSSRGVALSKMIVMLNATLPKLNPYFISGFETGDEYNYDFAEKTAEFSCTDSKTYFVHPNKLDIFNFSAKPEGNHPEIAILMKKALKFREENNDLITKGSFIPLKTGNKEVIAFARSHGTKTLIFIANRDILNPITIELRIKGLSNAGRVDNFAYNYSALFSEDQIISNLAAGETQVFIINNFNMDKFAEKVYK